MRRLLRFLTIGTYRSNTGMAQLQALALTGIILAVGLLGAFIIATIKAHS